MEFQILAASRFRHTGHGRSRAPGRFLRCSLHVWANLSMKTGLYTFPAILDLTLTYPPSIRTMIFLTIKLRNPRVFTPRVLETCSPTSVADMRARYSTSNRVVTTPKDVVPNPTSVIIAGLCNPPTTHRF